MGLYGGGPVLVSTVPRRLSELLGVVRPGYKVSFMRAGRDNVGTTWIGHVPTLSVASATGYVDAGEAISYDHPRPDTVDMWVMGTNYDVLHVTVLAESVGVP